MLNSLITRTLKTNQAKQRSQAIFGTEQTRTGRFNPVIHQAQTHSDQQKHTQANSLYCKGLNAKTQKNNRVFSLQTFTDI